MSYINIALTSKNKFPYSTFTEEALSSSPSLQWHQCPRTFILHNRLGHSGQIDKGGLIKDRISHPQIYTMSTYSGHPKLTSHWLNTTGLVQHTLRVIDSNQGLSYLLSNLIPRHHHTASWLVTILRQLLHVQSTSVWPWFTVFYSTRCHPLTHKRFSIIPQYRATTEEGPILFAVVKDYPLLHAVE